MVTLKEAIEIYGDKALRIYEDKADYAIREAARHHARVAFVNGAPSDICGILCKRYEAEGYLTKWYWDHKAGTFVVEIGGWTDV